MAAFTSALAVWLQDTHRKAAWFSRFFDDTCPQPEQRREVFAGFTAMTVTVVVALALSVRRCRNRPQA